MSVELDNGCHAMLDEGKTEKVRDDFSADATNMDYNGMDHVIYLKRRWWAILEVFSLKIAPKLDRFFNELNTLVIYKIKCLF